LRMDAWTLPCRGGAIFISTGRFTPHAMGFNTVYKIKY
jgi:hypothetical protein